MPGNGYFRSGSAAKVFTATVILQLAGEGRLALDDTVERWLPGVVRGRNNDGRQITVGQLLRHQAGIHDDLPGYQTAAEFDQQRYKTYTQLQITARAMRHDRDFVPGKGWAYCNTCYLLATLIIQKATGRTWDREVRDRIIRPLRLRHTYWPGKTPTLPVPSARGYQRFATDLVDVTEHSESYTAGGAGGLVSTTADLGTFLRAVVRGQLLRPAQQAALMETVDAPALWPLWPGITDGHGLFSRSLSCGGRYWTHGGDIVGFMTRVGVSADGRRSVVVSMSTEQTNSFDTLKAQDGAAGRLIDNALCG